MIPIFEAVFECPVEMDAPPWPVLPKVWPELIRVDGNLTDEEVGLLVALISGFQIEELSLSISELFQKIIDADGLILSGGIRVTEPHTGRTICPSCCCGLETWWEWVHCYEGGPGPWMGHDPFPGVERHASGFRVWSGKMEHPAPVVHPADNQPEDEFFIEVTPAEFEQNLRQVQQDLQQLLIRVMDWAVRLDALRAPLLVRKIDEDFGITRPHSKWQTAEG
ncbi:MAG: hypothetical protein K1Y36_22305 [Blastocatellia bacterium]|nr:hypothetical protein [Blastocatellia bacterium]